MEIFLAETVLGESCPHSRTALTLKYDTEQKIRRDQNVIVENIRSLADRGPAVVLTETTKQLTARIYRAFIYMERKRQLRTA